MVRKRNWAAATELLTNLPVLPHPWAVEDLCARVAEQRGRPVVLHSMDLPALPFGLWFDDGASDHIICRRGVSGFHRDHIILHELCHLLAGHNQLGMSERQVATTIPLDRLIERAIGSGHSTDQEEIAEMFASQVLRLAKRRPPGPVSEFEQRAAAMFGAA